MTEVWIIGSLGTASLAAIALAFPLLMLMQTLPGGALGGSVASSIARALGAGNHERAERLIWHALAIAAIGAALILLLFIFLGEGLFRFLGGSDTVLDQATSYGWILCSGGLFLWLIGVLTAVFRGMGDMRFPAMMMVIHAVIQVPVSICLVVGAFGLPQLGVSGAAVSAVLVSALISFIMLLRLGFGNTLIKLRLHTRLFSPDLFADIMRVAAPASLSPLLTVSTIVSLTAIVGGFGESALAGYGIGSRIEFLMIPLIFGLGAAMTSLVGMSIGAGDQARAERYRMDREFFGSCARRIGRNNSRCNGQLVDSSLYTRPRNTCRCAELHTYSRSVFHIYGSRLLTLFCLTGSGGNAVACRSDCHTNIRSCRGSVGVNTHFRLWIRRRLFCGGSRDGFLWNRDSNFAETRRLGGNKRLSYLLSARAGIINSAGNTLFMCGLKVLSMSSV